MKVIVSGGRNYQLTAGGFRILDSLAREFGFTTLVTGRATGIDASSERWAALRGLDVERFPADWKSLGKRAGPIRNTAMAEVADALVVFKGRAGTADMVRKAQAKGLQIFDYRDRDDVVELIK